MISYAQNFEDVILMRALSGIELGCYIDVGAAWPDQHSVTKAFYENGWNGINIEPNPIFFGMLESRRPRDKNICAAAGRTSGSLEINFFEETGLSTLVDYIAEKNKASGFSFVRSTVPVTTLDTIWQSFVPQDQDVHFLKVDVEGFERSVLEGNDWRKNRPWIVLVEATLPLSQIESYLDWEPILINADYIFAYADGLNRFYLAQERSHLISSFKYPPNVFDNFKTDIQVELERRILQFELDFNRLSEKLAVLERRAISSENGISELRQSASWRITLPLRWTSGLVFDCLSAVRQVINRLICGAIESFQLPLAHVMRAVLNRPLVSYRINKWLLHYPALHQQLVGVAKRHGALSDEPKEGRFKAKHQENIPLGLSDITPRARCIYADLIAAAKIHGENH